MPFPFLALLYRIADPGVTEHMRMAPRQFGDDGLYHGAEIEMVRLLGHLSVEHHLK